jgi:hypothetical protein
MVKEKPGKNTKKPMSKGCVAVLIGGFFVLSLAFGVLFGFYRTFLPLLDSLKTLKITAQSSPPGGVSHPELILTLPSSDVTGQDLTEVPRISKSVRTKYYSSLDGNFTSVEYVAPVSFNDVKVFYKNLLLNQNWQISFEDPSVLILKHLSSGDLTIKKIDEAVGPISKFSLNLTVSQ